MRARAFIIEFIRNHPFLVGLTLASSFSGAIFNSISVALIVPVILKLLNFEAFSMDNAPGILVKILSIADPFPVDWQGLVLVGVILGAIVLKNLASYATALLSSELSRCVVVDLQVRAVEFLLKIDLDFFSKTKIGDITNRFGSEISRTSQAISAVISLISNVITILGFAIILVSISWQLTLVSGLSLTVAAMMNQVSIRRAKNFGVQLSQRSAAQTGRLIDMLSGIRLVKTVGNEEIEAQSLINLTLLRSKAQFQSDANYSLIAPINEVSGITSLLIIVLWGRMFFADALESLAGILLTYLVLLFRLLPIIAQLNSSRGRLANSLPGVDVVADFLSIKNKPFMPDGKQLYSGFEEKICFENVDFAYPGSRDIALQNINLTLWKGKTVALVGTSGAGKSTLADLLPRFYDPDRGQITLDGVDIREFDMRSIRRKMGVVSQDTFLFNNTIRYNLMYGAEHKTEEELIDAAKRANAYEFIINLPDGFETEIGDRGVMLSGGQRQRLAIARALLRDPEILILDEATSALDTVSERLVQEAIEELCTNRTTLVIAHRLSTIRNADTIVVMEKGRIVELGSHAELIQKNQAYAALYNAQFSAENKDAIQQARVETLISLSYEVRTRLNPMIGFLNLLVDDDVESPEERHELTQESYNASVRLLRTLQYMENSAKSGAAISAQGASNDDLEI